jgi:hypothetical protein
VPVGWPHTRLVCTSAPGAGALLRVAVTVGGQTTTGAASVTVSYAPPTLTAVTGAGTVTITGNGALRNQTAPRAQRHFFNDNCIECNIINRIR